MSRKRVVIMGGVVLAVVWLIALAGVLATQSVKVTPEKVIAYVERQPLEGKSQDERKKIIGELASQVNQLSFEQRRDLRLASEHGQTVHDYYQSMTSEERALYLDLTLPVGTKQFIRALNRMDRAERQQIVSDALADMRRDYRENFHRVQRDLDDPNVQRIIDEGLKSFLSDADAETKIDLQPLIEQMQHLMKSRPHHDRD